MRREHYSVVIAMALLMGVFLGAANLIMGDLNQDEGWYLYAAQRLAEGWVLYKDFAFTQGPALPKIYALFAPAIDAGGIGAGRAITWTFGFLSAGLAALVARWLGGRASAAMCLTLLLVNVYHSYYTTVVKTYALSSLFIMLALVCLAYFVRKRPAPLWLALAGVALAAAAGTRLSLGILLAVTGCWMLIDRKSWGRSGWFYFGLGGAVGLVVIFLPAYLAAPEGFRFGVIEFHTMREPGSLFAGLVYKVGFVSRVIMAYAVAVVLMILMLAAKWIRPFASADSGYHQTGAFRLVRLMLGWVVAVTLVHLAAPFPYDDYQVPVFPVLAVALAVSWAYALRAWSGSGYRWEADVEPADPPLTRWVVWSLLVVSAAAAFSSPVNQDWMIAGRDRIWWKVKEKPALLQLREIAKEIRGMAPHGILLTQDTYLAVEAGLYVPLGWEMGPFSYYPDMDNRTAARLRLLNKDRAIGTIMTTHAEVAAFSGYGLAIASPDVQPLDEVTRADLLAALSTRFDLYKEVPSFGQAATTLKIYHLRDPHCDEHHH